MPKFFRKKKDESGIPDTGRGYSNPDDWSTDSVSKVMGKCYSPKCAKGKPEGTWRQGQVTVYRNRWMSCMCLKCKAHTDIAPEVKVVSSENSVFVPQYGDYLGKRFDFNEGDEDEGGEKGSGRYTRGPR